MALGKEVERTFVWQEQDPDVEEQGIDAGRGGSSIPYEGSGAWAASSEGFRGFRLIKWIYSFILKTQSHIDLTGYAYLGSSLTFFYDCMFGARTRVDSWHGAKLLTIKSRSKLLLHITCALSNSLEYMLALKLMEYEYLGARATRTRHVEGALFHLVTRTACQDSSNGENSLYSGRWKRAS